MNPPPARRGIIGPALLVSAAVIGLAALAIGAGMIPVDSDARGLVVGVMVLVAVNDALAGWWFLRRGR
jgi:hypothetical protein